MVVATCVEAVAHGIALPSSATLTFVFGCQLVPLSLLVTMVPSVRDDSARIVGTLFYAEMTNFAS